VARLRLRRRAARGPENPELRAWLGDHAEALENGLMPGLVGDMLCCCFYWAREP